MRKAFLFSGLALTATIILVLASVTYVLFNIDALIKDEVEDAASSAYKVPVTVAEATMSLKSGNGRIIGLRIENPPGFSAPTAVHVPVIEIAVDTGRIADKAIALGRVVIDRPEIVLDIKDGRVNLVRLKESTDAWLTRSGNDDEDAASGQRLIIDEIVMQNGTMVFRADFLDGAETEVPLPDSRVREIGVKPDGALPAEVISEVTQLLITASERASRRIDLQALAEKTGATVIGAVIAQDGFQDESFSPDREPAHDEMIDVDGDALRAIYSPGHVGNHFCYLHERSGLLFTGDHVMQGSTVVIIPPAGDMKDYIDSLRRMLDYPLKFIAPGHGGLIAEPAKELDYLVKHRLKREAKVADKLAAFEQVMLDELVLSVYDDVAPSLHPAAQYSLLAHLLKLEKEGRVWRNGDNWSLI